MEQTENLCRLCLGELTENLKYIFESYIDDTPLVEIIQIYCFKISIKIEDDHYPKCICENCFDILKNAYDLSEKSVQSEKHFHVLMADTVIKEEQFDYEDDEDYTLRTICSDVSIVKADVSEEETKVFQHENSNSDEEIPKPRRAKTKNRKCKVKLIVESEEDTEATQQEDPDEKKPKPKKAKTKRHQCKVCLKLFEKPSKLARHERTHDSTRRPFGCEECSQRFLTKESLERHKIIHSGMTLKIGPENKNWPCVICRKVFDTQTIMASHMRIHKDEMEKLEFACNLCDKVFHKLNDLTR